jgi:hypothetical protein
VLSEEEATQFLLTRTKQSDLAAARHLAATLGYLPLALEQAGAFIAQTKVIILARYLQLFEQRSLELLDKGRPRGRHERTVDTTWDLSLERLQQETPAAVELLNLLAFLAPDDLPWQLLASHADQLPDTLATAARDELVLAEVIGASQRYSLVKVTRGQAACSPAAASRHPPRPPCGCPAGVGGCCSPAACGQFPSRQRRRTNMGELPAHVPSCPGSHRARRTTRR